MEVKVAGILDSDTAVQFAVAPHNFDSEEAWAALRREPEPTPHKCGASTQERKLAGYIAWELQRQNRVRLRALGIQACVVIARALVHVRTFAAKDKDKGAPERMDFFFMVRRVRADADMQQPLDLKGCETDNWMCPKCEHHNFATAAACALCGHVFEDKPQKLVFDFKVVRSGTAGDGAESITAMPPLPDLHDPPPAAPPAGPWGPSTAPQFSAEILAVGKAPEPAAAGGTAGAALPSDGAGAPAEAHAPGPPGVPSAAAPALVCVAEERPAVEPLVDTSPDGAVAETSVVEAAGAAAPNGPAVMPVPAPCDGPIEEPPGVGGAAAPAQDGAGAPTAGAAGDDGAGAGQAHVEGGTAPAAAGQPAIPNGATE